MKRALKKIGRAFLNVLDDVFFCIGCISLVHGIYLIYIPAGYIVLGICFIAFAFFIAKKGG